MSAGSSVRYTSVGMQPQMLRPPQAARTPGTGLGYLQREPRRLRNARSTATFATSPATLLGEGCPTRVAEGVPGAPGAAKCRHA